MTFKAIREFDPDIVLTTYAHTSGFIGAIAASLTKKTCIVHAVGSDLKVQAQTLLGNWMTSLTFRISSGVVCVSNDLQNTAKQFGAKQTTIIPDPIETSECGCSTSKRKSNVIISVANLIPIKGLSYLVRAMARIDDCDLILIGEGEERKKLEKLCLELGVSSRVFFLGWVDHGPRFWNHLKEATIFVLPSISEGTPRALIEAMACGLPVVATAVGGIPEVVKDGVNGFLVSPRNEEQLANAIRKILDNDDFRNSVSVMNREMAKRYSVAIIGEELFDYLRNFIKA